MAGEHSTGIEPQSRVISPRAAVAMLLAISVVLGANHVCARISFDHGGSVATAVFARAGVTALALLALLRFSGVPLGLPRLTLMRGLAIGGLVCLQSLCIYSAIARIPVALALLAFNVFPMLYALWSWIFDGERPAPRAAAAMPVALVGLVLALDLVGSMDAIAGRWQEISTGVLFALGAAVWFSLALYCTGRWMQPVDGRLRTFLTTAVTAVFALGVGLSLDAFSVPRDLTGWTALLLLTVFYGSAFTALFIVQPLPGVARYTVALNFEPIAVLFMGWVVLGQAMKPLQLVGAAVVVAAMVLLASGKK